MGSEGSENGRWHMMTVVSRSISVGRRAKTPVRKVFKGFACLNAHRKHLAKRVKQRQEVKKEMISSGKFPRTGHKTSV